MTEYKHAEVLNDVANKGRAIGEFIENSPDCQILVEMLKDYEKARKKAGEVLKDAYQTDGTSKTLSDDGSVSCVVEKRQDIKGDKFIRVYGERLLKEAPLALKVTKEGLMDVGFEVPDLKDYLENPVFVATVTNKDKAVKAIAHKMKYLVEALGIYAPESMYELEQWYSLYDDMKAARE